MPVLGGVQHKGQLGKVKDMILQSKQREAERGQRDRSRDERKWAEQYRSKVVGRAHSVTNLPDPRFADPSRTDRQKSRDRKKDKLEEQGALLDKYV